MSRYPSVQPKFSIVTTWKQPSPAYSEVALMNDVKHRLRIEIVDVMPKIVSHAHQDRRGELVTLALVRADTVNICPDTGIKPRALLDYALKNRLRMTTLKQGLGALERYIGMHMAERLIICHPPVALPRVGNVRKMNRYRAMYTVGEHGPRLTAVQAANYNHRCAFLFEI